MHGVVGCRVGQVPVGEELPVDILCPLESELSTSYHSLHTLESVYAYVGEGVLANCWYDLSDLLWVFFRTVVYIRRVLCANFENCSIHFSTRVGKGMQASDGGQFYNDILPHEVSH